MISGDNRLRRSLSLPVVTLYGLGTIIGAGIYVLIGEVVATSGYLTPFAFLMASIIAGFSAFSYAELSSRFPLSAGEALYIENAFGIRAYSIGIGLVMVFIGITVSATLVRGFVGYFQYIIALDEQITITLLVLTIGAVAAWGIAQSAWLAVVTTMVEIGGLLLIIWVARSNFSEVPMLLEQAASQFSTVGWGALAAGAFIAFFAFLGFEDIVNMAEEVINPIRNLPLAVILSLVISSLLYFAISVIAIATVPPAELAGNPAPLALVYERATGAAPAFIVLSSIAAIINGSLIMMIMATRILYGMSRQKWLPKQLARVNPTTQTPLLTTILISLLVLIFALWLPVATLALTSSFFTLIVFLSINSALLVIKRRDRRHHSQPKGIRSYPIWIPVAGIISSAAFIISQLYYWLK